MQTIPVVIGAIVIILGIGYLATNNQVTPTSVTQESTQIQEPSQTQEVAQIQEPTQNVGNENVIDEESTLSADDTIPQVVTPETVVVSDNTPGIYTNYDANTLAQSDAKHNLLFFHATWCPSCRALDANILDNAEDIPADVAIYKVDYDTATDLKRRYGITRQHSIIEISATGEAKSAISHGLTLKDVLATI